MLIRVAGVDPAFRNIGIARLLLNTETMALVLQDLRLLTTENQASKTVRKNSDDLRRAMELHSGFIASTKDCSVIFAEVPTGAQSARAALGFGVAIGVLASSPIPIIQVQPFETKLATVGTKTASKEEMIEWATEAYPDGPWLTRKFKGKTHFTAANEHLADAVAVAHAGIKTDQFRQLVSLLTATRLAHSAA